jgi:hypothetical protein
MNGALTRGGALIRFYWFRLPLEGEHAYCGFATGHARPEFF